METLLHNISQVLGITVIHSLWQGLLVYLSLKVILTMAPGLSSVKKHNVGLVALFAMGAWFVGTLVNQACHIQWLADSAVNTTDNQPIALDIEVPTGNGAASGYEYVIKAYLPYIAVVYLIGLLLNVLKLCFAWRNIALVKRSLQHAGSLEASVRKLGALLNIRRKVSVHFTDMVDVPGIIGYLKPIILLPFSITANLSAAEVEAILLHELAHIKRNDYLLNILQQVSTVLLFFNPFAHLLNRMINNERENCCDDEVVAITGQPLIYARALLKLEQEKRSQLQLALAATGKKFVLLNRIERIMTTKKLTVNVHHILAAVALFTLSLGSIAWLNPEIKSDRITFNPASAGFAAMLTEPDTVPAKKKKLTYTSPKRRVITNKDKAYKSNKYDFTYAVTDTEDDPEIRRLSKELDKHGAAIDKFYNSPEFKKLTDQLEKESQKLNAFYERPEYKALLEKQERLSDEFEKNWNDNPEIEKLNKQIEEAGNRIEAYYNNPQYHNLEKQLEAESARLEKLDPMSAAYKAQVKKVSSLSRQIGAFASSPQIRAKQEHLRQLSATLRGIYSSEAYKSQEKEMRATIDSLRKIYQNSDLTRYQDNIREMSAELRNYQNNPAIKREQEMLRKASANLRAYMNSPAYKSKLKKARYYQNSFNYNTNGKAVEEIEIEEPMPMDTTKAN